MLLSGSCYLKDRCKKPIKDSSCTDGDIFCIKLFKIDRLYDNSLLSNKQRVHMPLNVDADGSDIEAFNRLKNIEEHINEFVCGGKNLYIHSNNTGNGKTSWSVRMMQAFIENNWIESDIDDCRALFINVPRFFSSLKDSFGKQNDYVDYVKAHVFEAELVVWDEVGVKNLSDFEHESLLNLINTRIDLGRSNIFTSNLSSYELRDNVGERLYSRIVNLSEDIEFFGADKRMVSR